jgi:hypothetical protein
MRPKLQPQPLIRQIPWLGLAAAVLGGLYAWGDRNFPAALILAGVIVSGIAFVRSPTSTRWLTRPSLTSLVDAAYLELAKALIGAGLTLDFILGTHVLWDLRVIDIRNEAIETIAVGVIFFLGIFSLIFFLCFLGTLAFIVVHRR